MHHQAEKVAAACAAPGCPNCDACRALPPVQMLQRLQVVRRWFRFDPGSSRSAWGLLMLELLCRGGPPTLHHCEQCEDVCEGLW